MNLLSQDVLLGKIFNVPVSVCTVAHQGKEQKCQDVSLFATPQCVDTNHVLKQAFRCMVFYYCCEQYPVECSHFSVVVQFQLKIHWYSSSVAASPLDFYCES